MVPRLTTANTAIGTNSRRATPARMNASTSNTANSVASTPSTSGVDNRSFSSAPSMPGIHTR